jgi:hypothetical protein
MEQHTVIVAIGYDVENIFIYGLVNLIHITIESFIMHTYALFNEDFKQLLFMSGNMDRL